MLTNELSLSTREKTIISNFKQKIGNRDEFRLGNEDIIYVDSFLNSLLSENYPSAAHIGYVFIEKYLRGILLFHKWNSSDKTEEFLYFLDREEKILEEGDDSVSAIMNKQYEITGLIKRFTFEDGSKKEEITTKLDEYLDLVVSEGKILKGQTHFNDICKEMKELGLLSSAKSKALKKLFSKFRNPLQHGLFKKLSSQMLEHDRMPIVAGGDGPIRLLEVDTSNIIAREGGMIEGILKDVCLELFNEISELIIEFSKK